MFNVGDEVRCIHLDGDCNHHVIGQTGRILHVDVSTYYIQWEVPHDSFHSSGGRGKVGYCWNIAIDDPCLELVAQLSPQEKVLKKIKYLRNKYEQHMADKATSF